MAESSLLIVGAGWLCRVQSVIGHINRKVRHFWCQMSPRSGRSDVRLSTCLQVAVDLL